MKKIFIFTLSVMLIFILSACEKTTTTLAILTTTKPTTSVSTVPSSVTTSVTTTLTTTTTITTITTAPTTSITSTVLTTTVSSLMATELPIHSTLYGNTNGNANNQGLAVYDKTNHIHYYALGPSVYAYNPSTDTTEILLTLSAGGNVRNLTLSSTYLYFVSSQDLYFHKFNLNTKTLTTVFEGETYKTYRYSGYVFINALNVTYQNTGIRKYYESSESFYSSWGYSATNVNISGLKLYYTTSNGPAIEVMADTFAGKTTVVSFTAQNIIEIKELLLLKDGDSKDFAFISKTNTEEALYLYNTVSGLEKVTVASGTGLKSINTDGNNLYFINGSNLYSLNLSTKDVVILKELNGEYKYINIINYWIYYSNSEMTSLYRIHPDTLESDQLLP